MKIHLDSVNKRENGVTNNRHQITNHPTKDARISLTYIFYCPDICTSPQCLIKCEYIAAYTLQQNGKHSYSSTSLLCHRAKNSWISIYCGRDGINFNRLVVISHTCVSEREECGQNGIRCTILDMDKIAELHSFYLHLIVFTAFNKSIHRCRRRCRWWWWWCSVTW